MLLEQKTISGYIIFIHKSYNEIVDEIVEMRPKTGQKWNFWEAVSHFVFDITFRHFLLWESYHRDKMIKSKKVSYF